MRRHIAVLAVFAVALLSVPVRAQIVASTEGTLAAGTRIRVTVATLRDPVIAEVLSHRAGTLVVRRELAGDTIAIPVGQVVRLDVSEGARTFRREGALIGLAGGAAIGAIVGAAAYREPACEKGSFMCIDLGPGLEAMADAVVGGLAGALLGSLIGSRTTERWKRMVGPLYDGPRVGIAPSSRGGMVLTTSLAF